MALELEVETPLEIPFSRRFEGRCQPRPRETLLSPAVLRYCTGDGGNLELSVLHAFRFDLSCIFMTSNQFMHLLPTGVLAALDSHARESSVSVRWGMGHFAIQGPA